MQEASSSVDEQRLLPCCSGHDHRTMYATWLTPRLKLTFGTVYRSSEEPGTDVASLDQIGGDSDAGHAGGRGRTEPFYAVKGSLLSEPGARVTVGSSRSAGRGHA